jgi:signal transduction histidine kinase
MAIAGSELIGLFARFADPAARADAAGDLARALEVDRILFFVRDPELDALIPAPGFPQTIRGGPQWRRFVRSCQRVGRHVAEVDDVAEFEGTLRVTAHVHELGAALFLFGREPSASVLSDTLVALPLIGAVMRAEHATQLAQGQAEVARATGRHANALASALDASRVELEHALAESARLNSELEERDRRKDDFLAMLGHELRNPMAAISGAIEVMRLRPDDAEQLQKARAVLERQAEQLARLVDDLLDVARITRGKVVLRPEHLDVTSVVRRAVDAAQSMAAAKRHSIRLDVRGPTHANADRTRLEQMVTNLLTNAIKYTDPGGRIDVTVEREGGDALVSVKDDGIGIPRDLLPRIFDAFHQVDPAIDRGAGGLGVGLTVASRLAALHGGRIDVRSAIGRGSTFTIRLPAIDAPSSREPARPLPAVATSEGLHLRVLVVDDNVDSGEMLAALLESWGHESHHAVDGPSALERALALRPDVVLLDIGLPGMDGYEVAARLRAHPATTSARIIALSGYGQDSDRTRSRAAGCDDHLVKPVDVRLLRQRLAGEQS